MKTFKPTDKSNFLPMLKTEILLRSLNRTPIWNIPKRDFIMRKLFGSIDGTAYTILQPFQVSYGKNISIGKNFFANWNVCILDHAEVKIGDGVLIAPNVIITTVTHPKDAQQRMVKVMDNSFEPKKRGNIELIAPITIGDNVWIASGSVICPGVTIGENSIIGANSVVTKDIPPNVLACGAPCKVVRTITEKDKIDYKEI